eukprot:366238-Chlamydomonas_euryale.AAC.9
MTLWWRRVMRLPVPSARNTVSCCLATCSARVGRRMERQVWRGCGQLRVGAGHLGLLETLSRPEACCSNVRSMCPAINTQRAWVVRGRVKSAGLPTCGAP